MNLLDYNDDENKYIRMKQLGVGVGCVVVIAMMIMGCGSKAEKAGKVDVSSPQTVNVYDISAEDSAMMVDVFRAYLAVSQDEADSAAMTAGDVAERINIPASEEEAHYRQNKAHCDSLMDRCIWLVQERRYDDLYDLLDGERVNIYVHPGNTVDNESGLVSIVDLLCEQRFSTEEAEFYLRMKPWYENLRLHMEILEMLYHKQHPDYKTVLELSANIYEMIGGPDEFLNTALIIAGMEDAEKDPQGYINSRLMLNRAYQRNGMEKSADSCLNVIRYMRY